MILSLGYASRADACFKWLNHGTKFLVRTQNPLTFIGLVNLLRSGKTKSSLLCPDTLPMFMSCNLRAHLFPRVASLGSAPERNIFCEYLKYFFGLSLILLVDTFSFSAFN